ncbi:MAG: hypothetical protein SVK08_13215 [Halobacteriota archaeon]|nr:hypothetical protein [Halobacteriota archaeon]
MPRKNQISVRLDEVHLEIIDGLQPHFGNSRPEVIRNLIVDWITYNIGSENIEKLQDIGAIKLKKSESE